MRNIKLTLEYDGSRYSGWQRLGKGESENTIENKLLEVLSRLPGGATELNCGSRTEVGVHAYGQIVNFKTKSELKLYEIKNYLNRYLPMDIAVLQAEEMPERFHATLNAKSKTYLYRIAIGDAPSVFDRKYTYYSFRKPDIEKMREAARLLIGKYDCKDFSTVKKSKSTVKEIYTITIEEKGQELHITMTANDFLHNMARMLAATLLDIGLGQRAPKDITAILDPEQDVVASLPASAQGLFLQKIEY